MVRSLRLLSVVAALGILSVTVGCGSSAPTTKPSTPDKMGGDKMGGDKMGTDKMGTDKMGEKK